MGHYASEMQCDDCGKLRCVCKPKPDKSLQQWLVDDDYSVIKARDFEEKHGYTTMFGMKVKNPGTGLLKRCSREHFDLRSRAEQHALELLRKAVKSSEERTSALKARLAELEAVPLTDDEASKPHVPNWQKC
jgi:hypothetical protein